MMPIVLSDSIIIFYDSNQWHDDLPPGSLGRCAGYRPLTITSYKKMAFFLGSDSKMA
jgi:hypothetical protein